MESDANNHSIEGKAIKRSTKSNDEGEDIISKLPEDIIGGILSLLPTKDAVQTSILSSRWKYQWTFITRLHFDDKRPCALNKKLRTHFQNFVYSVLLHLKNSTVRSFSLCVSECYDSYHVSKWISVVLKREVKELSIHSTKKLDISLDSLFESRFLEKLVLDTEGCAIRVPTHVCFSSLTVLKLTGITFKCFSSNDSQNLTLNFPVLREFKKMECKWFNVKGVTFEVPLLKFLFITQKCLPMFGESGTIIKFCAPCLLGFSYDGLSLYYILLDAHARTCIAVANIHPWHSGMGSEIATSLITCNLLRRISHRVKYLKFERGEALAPVLNCIPKFQVLNSLELKNVSGEILLIILRNSPYLKILFVKGLEKFDEEHSKPGYVPNCFVSKLEVFMMEMYSRIEVKLRFTKFVMENARVLRKASFFCRSNMRQTTFEKARDKILSFKRSVSCMVPEFIST